MTMFMFIKAAFGVPSGLFECRVLYSVDCTSVQCGLCLMNRLCVENEQLLL